MGWGWWFVTFLMKVLLISMDKQLDTNTAFIQVRVDIDLCGSLASEFVKKHFGSDQFSTISSDQENHSLIIGFGYKVNGYEREVGHIIYKPADLVMCIVVINEFAKKRFIDHLDNNDVKYRVLKWTQRQTLTHKTNCKWTL